MAQTATERSARRFAPDAGRAASLDQAVRNGLADSLITIFAALDQPRGQDDPALAALLARVRAAPVAPGLFGLYVELVLALFGDRMADADRTIAALQQPQPTAPPFRVCTLDDAVLGEGQAARYRRLLGDIACPIGPLDAAELGAASRRLDEALALMRTGAPDVFAEFQALVREVVLVRPDVAPGGRSFGAASSFSLWGALTMNAQAMPERLSVAMQLAHECAHTLLFGLALGGRITENEEEERYPSPLRSDERPMEGVAHATFVSGRMIYLLDRLLDSGVLTAVEAADARSRLTELEPLQAQGRETVRQHGRLAGAGAEAFADLDAFVAARAALTRA